MTVAASRTRIDRADMIAVFHALSDETRLAVLELLRGGEQCVCDLQDAVGAAQSRLSFHLKVLKDAGLVTDRREGRWAYYALDANRLAEATDALGVLATPSTRSRGPVLHALERAGHSVRRPSGTSAGGNKAQPATTKRGCC
jgi:ArsR family transcriptional regulator